jgi:hypothetical protein
MRIYAKISTEYLLNSKKSSTFGTPLFASEQGILRKYGRVLPDICKGGIFFTSLPACLFCPHKISSYASIAAIYSD